jgi:hypothetical protein
MYAEKEPLLHQIADRSTLCCGPSVAPQRVPSDDPFSGVSLEAGAAAVKLNNCSDTSSICRARRSDFGGAGLSVNDAGVSMRCAGPSRLLDVWIIMVSCAHARVTRSV